MKISAKFLTDRDACNEQVKLFRKTFPRGATINDANLLKANKAGLSLYWLIRKLRGSNLVDSIPYTQIERTKEARAFYKLDRQIDCELDRAYRTTGRLRETAWRAKKKAIGAIRRNHDLSLNQQIKLEKAEQRKYHAVCRKLDKQDASARKVIRAKYRSELRPLRNARIRREAEMLIPYVLEAVALYKAQQATK